MPFRKSKPVQLAGGAVVVVALALTALAISRPAASPSASVNGSTAAEPTQTFSASQAASPSQAITALPDPCSLLTSSDVQSFLDGINDGVWGYRNFSGPENEQGSCAWRFEQYLLSNGETRTGPEGGAFSAGVSSAPDTSCQDFVAADPDRVALAGIGDCAFSTGHAGAGVIVGDVYAFAGLRQGGTPATGETLRAIEADLAGRLAAALAP